MFYEKGSGVNPYVSQRSGAAKESQNAKRKTQKSKPGVRRGGAAKENQKAKRKRQKAKVESPC
jgi:hypothetical protein